MRTDILEKKDQILEWIEQEQPKSYMCQQLGCKPETLNSYMKKMGIEYAGQQAKKGQYKGGNQYKSAMYYIENNIPIHSHKLKEKLIRDGLKEEKCELCGIRTWYNKKIPLELHHKNGDHQDNSLDNLIILCPNCHSIQPGNSGANVGKYTTLEKQTNSTNTFTPATVIRKNNSVTKKVENFCCDCGAEISAHATRCKKCASIESHKGKTNKPPREELKELIRTTPFLQIGKMFGVSDNAVRKWCVGYGLPKKSSDIKSYSDEEWINI